MNFAGTPFDEQAPNGYETYVRSAPTADSGNNLASLLDIQRVMSAVSRNRWIILGIIALALLIGAAITLLTTPQYTATASVMIEQQTDRVLESEDMPTQLSAVDSERFLQTQVEILESRHLVLEVIEQEQLLDNPAFLASAGIEPDMQLPERVREGRLREAVFNRVDSSVEIIAPLISRIVGVRYTDPSPELSARIANAFVEAFMRDNLDRRAESSRYAREYLSTRLAEAKTRLEESERELNAYSQATGIVPIKDEGSELQGRGSTVTSRSLVRLNNAAADAEAARAAAEARWRAASAAPAGQLSEVVGNSAYQTLQTERSRVLAELNQELTQHQEDHPNVIALRSQLESMDREVARIAANIKQSIRANYDAALREEQALKSRVTGLSNEFLQEDSRGVQYGILAREVDTNRTMYDGLLQRFKEASAEEGLTNNNVSQVDEAVPPVGPSVPNPLLNMGLALVLGVLIASAVTFIREVVDDILRTPGDVEERLGLHTLGIIPGVGDDEDLEEVLLDPKSELSEAVHSLRTSVMLALESAGTKVMVATSTEAGEGKSTTMVALARDLAVLGRRVLLVDADLRRPRLHKMFDVPNRVGLSDLIAGSGAESDAVRRLANKDFDFLSSGTEVVDPATLLESDRLALLVGEFAKRYDYVLVDGPPVLGLADAPNLASKLGSTLFVMESGRIHARRARVAIRRLTDAGAKVLGGVLTKVDFRKLSSGYAYEYGYSQSYYSYANKH